MPRAAPQGDVGIHLAEQVGLRLARGAAVLPLLGPRTAPGLRLGLGAGHRQGGDLLVLLRAATGLLGLVALADMAVEIGVAGQGKFERFSILGGLPPVGSPARSLFLVTHPSPRG